MITFSSLSCNAFAEGDQDIHRNYWFKETAASPHYIRACGCCELS